MEWQPIDSAPKDGRFLAATEVHNNRSNKTFWEMHVVWLDDETGEIDSGCDSGWSYLEDYTHWMPLPTPPETHNGQ